MCQWLKIMQWTWYDEMMHEKSSRRIWKCLGFGSYVRVGTVLDKIAESVESARSLGGMIWSVWIGWPIESKCLISNIEWNMVKILSLKITNRPFLKDYDSKLPLPKDFSSVLIGFGWSLQIKFVLLFFFFIVDSAFFLFRVVHKNLCATIIIQCIIFYLS